MNHQIKRRQLLGWIGATPLVLAGCGGGGGGGDDGSTTVNFAARAMVDNLGDAIITQTYINLNTQAAALLAAATALQGGATELEMDAAQAAWKNTRVPWESSEGFLFGPVDSASIDPSIDSWPLDTPSLQQFLVNNPNPAVADIENASDDLRGFHAMEFLLFGDGAADNDKTASQLTAAEANYLAALAGAFKNRTQELVDAWTTGGTASYGSLLKNPGATNPSYASYAAVVQELINGLAGIADEVGNAKMSEPLGASAAAADVTQVESQYSWNSLTDFHNNIQSVMNIYAGQLGYSWSAGAPSSNLNGLYAFVQAHDSTLATRVFNEIRDTQQKVALIKGDGDNTTTVIGAGAQPFRNQISIPGGRALITTAIAACSTLRASLENDVAPLVGNTSFTT